VVYSRVPQGWVQLAVCPPDAEQPRAKVLEPVTESLVVHWWPTVQYHVRRLDVLTTLRSEGLLRQWHVDEEEVAARTEAVQLTMAEDRVSVYPRGSLVDAETRRVLTLAFNTSSPPSYHYHALFQYLIPISAKGYDEARASALQAMGLPASDFALVLDGTRHDTPWHGEVGIVAKNEVEPRMRRWVGGISELEGPLPLFIDLPAETAPVSFFADFAWLAPERDTSDTAEETVSDLVTQVQELRGAASRTVAEIYARLCQDSLQSVAGGSEL
jgi:hypothetical protein